MIDGAASLAFVPLAPLWLLAALAVAVALLLGYALIRRARGVGFRAAAFAVGLLALVNPEVVEEEREPLREVAVVVVDNSRSQDVGERMPRAEAALAELTAALAAFNDLEVRVVRAGNEEGGDGTRLFGALDRALADVPPERVAATVLITDGQIHDAPDQASLEGGDASGPVHTLLTGARDEGRPAADRRARAVVRGGGRADRRHRPRRGHDGLGGRRRSTHLHGRRRRGAHDTRARGPGCGVPRDLGARRANRAGA